MDAKPSLTEIAAKAGLEAVPYGGVLNEVISGLQSRRAYVAEHALGAIAERVGWDALLAVIERDAEREALLWTALQSITMTGVESKRRVLRNVVVNALSSTEPIDMEQLQVMALGELDAPHIRALARLADAEDRDTHEGSTDREDNLLEVAVDAEPIPVLAALIRSGVVYPGGMVEMGGLGRAPSARELSVSGVTPFGRELLVALSCVEEDGDADQPPTGEQEDSGRGLAGFLGV